MPFKDINPRVSVIINGTQLWRGQETPTAVTQLSAELSRDKSDLITLNIVNPIADAVGKVRTSNLLWTEHTAFAPGNVAEVFFSYADDDPEFVAAGEIRKWLPQFPRNGIPELQLKCFDGSCLLMDGTEEVVATEARSFGKGTTLSDQVNQILADYPIDPFDIEEIDTEPAVPTVKKAGMSDYQYIKALANLVGFEFFVEWDLFNKKWLAYWRKPIVDRDNTQTWVWGPDFNEGTGKGRLLEFFPEFAIQGGTTDVQAFYYDRDTLTWEEVIYPIKKSTKKQKFTWKGDDTNISKELSEVGSYESGAGLRILAGGVSVEVLPETGFRSAEDALKFARAWWEKKQELLIQGSGATIGWTRFRPNQVHILEGIGSLSGEWNVPDLTHEYIQGQGYECKIYCRKIIP